MFIGGGQGTTSAAAITNGSVSVDLSTSTVDTQSLGLKGFTAGYQVAAGVNDSGLYDLGSSSTTSVANIIAQTGATNTSFVISGPGFSGGAGGAITVQVNLSNVGDTTSLAAAINAGIQGAEQAGTPQGGAFKAANIQAVVHTGSDGHQQLQFVSASTAFDVTAGDTTANGFLGNLGTNTAGSATGATSTPEALGATSELIAGGTQQTAGLVYTTMAHNAGGGGAEDAETLTFVANNAAGVPQTVKVTLDAGTVADMTAAGAVAQINQQLQATDNPALQSLVATTDGGASGAGKIYFASNSSSPFSVTVGAETAGGTVGTTGFAAAYNTIAQSQIKGVGATSDIGTQADAEAAVSALANSVTALGNAQATVGRGENQFNYAINLAQSQLTNFTTAESGIRDADLAAEAANLTKAQILMQAGVAALAQANSAPQAVLALLK